MNLVAALALVSGLGLGACSGAPAPPDLAATAYQTRSDVALGAFELQVTNPGTGDVQITGAALESGLLSAPALAQRGARIGPGQVVDLKVTLPPATCPAVPDEPLARLAGTVDGAEFETAIPAPDRLGQLARLAADECAQRDIAGAVTITPPPRVRPPLTLVFGVRPLGAVRLGRPGPTTLLTPVAFDPAPAAVTAEDPPFRLVLRYEPTRCDAHAIAEDKQGTLLPLTARLPERPATRITLPMTASLRAEIQRAVARECGLD